MGMYKHTYKLTLRRYNGEVVEFEKVDKKKLLEQIEFHLKWDATNRKIDHCYMIKIDRD